MDYRSEAQKVLHTLHLLVTCLAKQGFVNVLKGANANANCRFLQALGSEFSPKC